MKEYQFGCIMAALSAIAFLLCSSSPKLAGSFGQLMTLVFYAGFGIYAVVHWLQGK